MSTDNIFDLSTDDFEDKEEKSGPSLYKPKADEGKDGVYTSLIRFIPNVKDPQHSRIKKYSHWLTDDEGNGFYFDCPTTNGDKCPICSKFFELRESESALEKDRSSDFRRSTNHFHLIQIVDDKIRPELNGTIQIFKYGKTIDDKYQAQLNAEFSEPIIPSDVFEGKPFMLKITKKNRWNNYDACEFLDQKPISIDGEEMTKGDKDDMKKIVEHLEEKSPDLAKFGYTPWNDKDKQKINSILNDDISGTVGDLESSLEENMDDSAGDLSDSTLESFVESEQKDTKKKSKSKSKSKKKKQSLEPVAKQETSNDDEDDLEDFEDEFDDDFLNEL